MSILVILFTLLIVTQTSVLQLNQKKWNQMFPPDQPEVWNTTYSHVMVYFYSSGCPFCQQFTPKYQKASQKAEKYFPDVLFTKIDAIAYKSISGKFQVLSYPTIALFFNNVREPIYYKEQRQIKTMLSFINSTIHSKVVELIDDEKKLEQVLDKLIVYEGQRYSYEYNQTLVLSLRDKFKPIGFKNSESNNRLIFYGKNYDNPFKGQNNIAFYEQQHRKLKAQVFVLAQQPWMRLFLLKQQGIVFINPNNNTKFVDQFLSPLAVKYPNIVFLNIQPSHSQYEEALQQLQMSNEEKLIGVDQAAQAKFEMTPEQEQQPYKLENIQQFVKGVIARTQKVYLRTQKAQNPHVLTRSNFEQLFDKQQPYDILLFLYSSKTAKSQKTARKLLSLFQSLLTKHKLKQNPHLRLLHCDIAKNQMIDKLQMNLDENTVPKILYYRNRMKHLPIYFANNIINENSIIEFILENTTEEWEGYQL